MFFNVKDFNLKELRTVLRHVNKHWEQAVYFQDKDATINATLLLHDLQLELNRRMKGKR
jgi:dihydroorotase